MKRLLAYLEEYHLLVLTLLLIVLIPLWPKIPLIQPIPGYIVRIRLEDVFVGLTGLAFVRQLLRKKVSLRTPLTVWMLVYLIVGLVSLLSAFFFVETLPIKLPHVAKAVLHWLRYMEYFSLFFFVFFSIRKLANARWFVMALCAVILGISIYGAGQKYWKWPVYSTMNYEFSAGTPLELVNPQSRVQSTFAGHYDFALYVNIILPIVLALLFAEPPKKQGLVFTKLSVRQEKSVLAVVFLLALWCLIVSGLRSAFVSYVAMVGILTGLFAWWQPSWPRRLVWFATRISVVGLVTLCMFAAFGNNLQALLSHAAAGLFPGIFAKKTTSSNTIDQTVISQYQLPVPKDRVDQYLASGGGKPAELSGCALNKEISLCIRLESLWPQAIAGFIQQPLVGSGYSSLNKRDFHHLSEADGTDNNYLRMLGETGLLGLVSFLLIIGAATKQTITVTFAALRNASKKTAVFYSLDSALGLGLVALVVGIMLNALLFDVFAASKVAFGFWGVTGLVLGTAQLRLPQAGVSIKK